jgi:hypothetical protein
MSALLPYTYIVHLVSELRLSAVENVEESFSNDEWSWKLGMVAALLNDAADAIEALANERQVNTNSRRPVFTLVPSSSQFEI